jgi:hypothetical protein
MDGGREEVGPSSGLLEKNRMNKIIYCDIGFIVAYHSCENGREGGKGREGKGIHVVISLVRAFLCLFYRVRIDGLSLCLGSRS